MATPEDQIPKEPETISTLDGADSSKGGTESEPTIQEPSVPTTPEPSAPLFQGTRIEGRTQEEGLAYIKLLEQTVNEQKDRITEGERETVQSSPVVEPEEDDVNFFDNPKEAIRREMERAIAPINDQIAAFRAQGIAQSAWTAIEQEIPDFPQFRHLVDQLVQAKGYSQADITVEVLRQLYYTAVGWNQRHGGTQVVTPAQATQDVAQNIPQHRPSTAPLPKEASDEPKQRELTENERRLAAEWNMSHAEYLRLQDENLELENYHADNA